MSRVARLAAAPVTRPGHRGARMGLARPRPEPGTGDALRVLTAVAAALRSGATPEAAWARVGVPTQDGVPDAAAAARVLPPRAVAPTVAAIHLARDVGAPLAAVIDRVARLLERAGEAADRRAEALAGPRTTATVLAWLPAVGLILGLVLGVNPLAVLLDGAGGTGLLVTGAVLTALGRAWTRRLVTTAQKVEEPPAAVVLDLLDMALAAGVDLPRALAAVGAVTGEAGAELTTAAGHLVGGASWPAAWAGASPDLAPVVAALRPAWVEGASAGPGLRAAAEQCRRGAHTAALEAAGRLAVTLVLPLGLCHLPAFVAVGLVPVLAAMAGGGG